MPRSRDVHSELDPNLRLSDRQVGIVDCLFHGLQPKQIAPLVHLSYHTVVEHIDRAKHALRANTHAQLVAEAILHGFLVLSVPPPPTQDPPRPAAG